MKLVKQTLRDQRTIQNYNLYRSMFSDSRERKVNKRGEEREREETRRGGMKNVRRPQESVAKVVAVDACTGLTGTR